MPYAHHWCGGFGWIFPVAFLAFIAVMMILMIVKCWREGWRGCCGMMGGPGAGAGQETPLDVLKKRYAKGEISKDEFDRMKRDIQD